MKFIVFCIKLLVVIGVYFLVSLGFYGIIYLIYPTNAVEIFGCIMVVCMGVVVFGMLFMAGLPGAFDKTWIGKGIQYVFNFLE